MCSYCGCESESVIAELMADHETVGMLVYHASSAVAAGDAESAVAACRQISDLFARHGRKEESGIFTELRAGGLALDAVEGLERDHRRLGAGPALLAGGDLAALGGCWPTSSSTPTARTPICSQRPSTSSPTRHGGG